MRWFICLCMLATFFSVCSGGDPEPREITWNFELAEPDRWREGRKAQSDEFRKIQRFFIRRTKKWMKSPLLVDRGRVVFIQPDNSLTMIDLEMGKSIFRRRSFMELRSGTRHAYSLNADRWECVGNTIVGWNDLLGGAILARRDDGEILNVVFKNPILCAGKFFITEYSGCSVLDAGSHVRTKLVEGQVLAAGSMDNSFFCITTDQWNREAQPIINGYSALDLTLRWSKTLDGEEEVLALVCAEGNVYVFVGVLGQEKYLSRCTAVRVFDADGTELERREATPDMFADPDEANRPGVVCTSYDEKGKSRTVEVERNRELLKPFNPVRFFFNGVKYEYGRVVTKRRVDLFENYGADDIEYAQAEHGAAESTFAATRLPGNGIAWIESPWTRIVGLGWLNDENREFSLYYSDPDRQWSGVLGTVDDLQLYSKFDVLNPRAFAMGGDDKYIVYASFSGRVECLERATGASRWIYVFPIIAIPGEVDVFSLGIWGRRDFAPDGRFFRGSFYTDMEDVDLNVLLESDLSPDGITAFRLSGDATAPEAVIHIDPDPVRSIPKEVNIPVVLVWLIPLLSLVCLLYFRNSNFAACIMVVLAILCCNTVAYFCWGGYSRPTLAAMVLAVSATLFFFVWKLVKSGQKSLGGQQ